MDVEGLHGIFFIECSWDFKKESLFNPTHAHLGMPYSKNGTDGTNLSKTIARQVMDNDVNNMVVAYTSDDGSNLKTYQDNLDIMVSNADIFRTPKELFRQDCFVHALQGGCKSDILDCKSPESVKEIEAIVRVSETRKRMQACMKSAWWDDAGRGSITYSSPDRKVINTCENSSGLFG